MKKKLVALLCVGALALSLTACTEKSDQAAAEAETQDTTEAADASDAPEETDTQGTEDVQESSGGTKQIAYLTPGLDLPFWRYLANGIENEVIDSGMDATVQVYDSNNSSEIQLQNAQDAIAKQVDMIIISPTDSSSCPAVLAMAEDAEIPVVIADIGTDSGKYDAFIVTPNAEGSQELGEYVLQYMKDNGVAGTAAQITGSLARNNIKARYEGFNAALEKFNVELVDYTQMSQFTRAEAEGFTQDLMTTYGDLGVVFVHMDEPTLGAVKAVQNADKGDSVIVCGFDGTPETVQEIEAGRLLAAAIQQPALMGKLAVQAASQIFNGETPEEQIDVPTLLVTAENCGDEEVVKQLQENVFPESKAK